MKTKQYVSPVLNLKEVSSEDILNTSSEIVEEENELLLDASTLYSSLF